jgi:hypothetical protein
MRRRALLLALSLLLAVCAFGLAACGSDDGGPPVAPGATSPGGTTGTDTGGGYGGYGE